MIDSIVNAATRADMHAAMIAAGATEVPTLEISLSVREWNRLHPDIARTRRTRS